MPALSYSDLADRVTDHVVAGIGRVEGAVVGSTGALASLAGRSPSRRGLLPVAVRPALLRTVPSARRIAEVNFSVLERLLAAQKEYAVNVLGALTGQPRRVPQPAASRVQAAPSVVEPSVAKPATSAPVVTESAPSRPSAQGAATKPAAKASARTTKAAPRKAAAPKTGDS